MAVIAVFFAGDFQVQTDNPNLPPEIFEFESLNIKSGGLVGSGGDGTFAAYAPPPPSFAISAYELRGFAYDFFYRIYITPSFVNAGNIVGTQQQSVTVWNAYPEASVTLEAAAVTGDAGTSVSVPFGLVFPYEMKPTEEVVFTLAIGQNGPPNVDATLTFTVEGFGYEVPVTGRRVVLFPFPPNWRDSVDETITVESWAIRSEDGGEQTGSSWGQSASRTFEYNVVLRTPEEMQFAENLLFAWQGRFFGLPIWTEKRTLQVAAADGATTLSFDTAGFSAESGSLVVLWNWPDRTEVKEVDAVTAGGVTLTTPLDDAWDQHTTVYPLAVALMAADASFSRETTGVARVPVMFECEPSATPGNIDPALPEATYRGDELYIRPVNWIGAQPADYASDRKKIDYGTLKFTAAAQSGFSRYSKRHNWLLEDEPDKIAFRSFLGRRQGMALPVWMPSGVNDFTIIEDALSTNSFILVEPNGYDTLVGQHPARRDIIIELWGGGYICRRIVSSVQEAEGLRLNLDALNGLDILVGGVKRISYLTWYRLASPSTTIRHRTEDKAVVEANVTAKLTR